MYKNTSYKMDWAAGAAGRGRARLGAAARIYWQWHCWRLRGERRAGGRTGRAGPGHVCTENAAIGRARNRGGAAAAAAAAATALGGLFASAPGRRSADGAGQSLPQLGRQLTAGDLAARTELVRRYPLVRQPAETPDTGAVSTGGHTEGSTGDRRSATEGSTCDQRSVTEGSTGDRRSATEGSTCDQRSVTGGSTGRPAVSQRAAQVTSGPPQRAVQVTSGQPQRAAQVTSGQLQRAAQVTSGQSQRAAQVTGGPPQRAAQDDRRSAHRWQHR